MPDRSWVFLSRREVSDHGIFRLCADRFRLEPEGRERDFVVLDGPDWVSVIPLTCSGEVVLIRQYRHGLRRTTLEIPGGMVDRGERPEQAAMRELREETGYLAPSVRSLGSVSPNPAIQSNTHHCFLAEGVELAGRPSPDPWERIEVLTRPLEEIPGLIRRGEIVHSLVVVSFGLLGILAEPR